MGEVVFFLIFVPNMNAPDPHINIFIAYSRKDKEFLDDLRTYLKPLERRNNDLTIWYDGKIDPGTKWNTAIKNHLRKADIILLLISGHSLASDYFYNEEMRDALIRHENDEAIVIPIILKACDWQEEEFGVLQVLPDNGDPLTKWEKKEEAYTIIVKGIGKRVEDVQEKYAWEALPLMEDPAALSSENLVKKSKNTEDTEKQGWELIESNQGKTTQIKEPQLIKEGERRIVKITTQPIISSIIIMLLISATLFTFLFFRKQDIINYNSNSSDKNLKTEIVEEGKSTCEILILKANELRIDGRYDDAIIAYQNALKLDSTKRIVKNWIDECNLEKKDKIHIDNMYFQLINEANDLFGNKKYNLSIGKYKRALELKKEGEEAKKGIANCKKAEIKKEEIIQKIMNDMIYVKGGKYQTNDNKTQKVDSFYISKYEVTQEQWQVIMADNPSKFNNCSQCPVEQISWYDVQKFITRFNAITGKIFRLPNEIEWEFAAKGGMKSKGYKYAGSNIINVVAWHAENSKGRTNFVGSKFPNELGLYDMSGNVWEWCNDDYYKGNLKIQNSEISRVLRGASWYENITYSGFESRSYYNSNDSLSVVGFRLAQNP